MLKTLKAVSFSAFIMTVLAGCEATKSMPKDLVDDAQPIYQECIADMKQKMTDEEARQVCTDRLKASLQKIKK